jgi:hypothetical protein
MSDNLILGSSHVLMFARAVGDFAADLDAATRDLVHIESPRGVQNSLLFTTNRPGFVELKRAPNGGIVGEFGPLMDKVRAFNRPGAKVILGIGGNEHNIRFLTADPRPFDFVHPISPGVEPGRQLVPAREIAAVMRALLERTLVVTRLIAAELPKAQLHYLPPPPPIPSDEHLRANREVFDFTTRGIEAASVRLKIQALYMEILQGFCAATGIRLIPPVTENQDDRGFLAEPYWQGATHATSAYYASIVSDLGL